tara:strand:+ start:84 stop:287 length:204 start_codon:yes stop_codon:yes gene_type:complete
MSDLQERAINKIDAILTAKGFELSVSIKNLDAKQYGGVSRDEQLLVVNGIGKEIEVFEHILNALNKE